MKEDTTLAMVLSFYLIPKFQGRGEGGLPVEAGVVRQLRQVMRIAQQSLTQFCCNARPAS